MPAPESQPTAPRVLSIDILRGLTIALMILVNDPGDSAHTYAQLDHAPWNGCTLTDLVFPSFLFLVGCATILSTQNRLARGVRRSTLALKVLRRSATIFLLDLFLAAFPYFHLTHLRLYGVLTRIALCYLVVGLLTLATRRVVLLLSLAATALVGYWALLRFVPVPGFGHPGIDIPFLDPDRNLVAWLDRGINAFLQRTIHTGRLYEVTRDPEGLLSTIPAIAQTILGAVVALWLVRTRHPAPPALPFPVSTLPASPPPATPVSTSPAIPAGSPPPTPASTSPSKSAGTPASARPSAAPLLRRWYPRTEEHRRDGLLAFGLTLLFLGLVWSHWFPLNKKLWTSSFVLFSTGCSTLALSGLYWIYDVRHLERSSLPLRLLKKPALIFGSNAITAFVVSGLLVRLMLLLRLPVGNLPQLPSPTHPILSTHISAWLWTYRHLFAYRESTNLSSLLFALTVVLLCFLPNYLLYRKKIFLRL